MLLWMTSTAAPISVAIIMPSPVSVSGNIDCQPGRPS